MSETLAHGLKKCEHLLSLGAAREPGVQEMFWKSTQVKRRQLTADLLSHLAPSLHGW
jgi:hypothetical protein